MQSITFECEVITPMFLAGADGVTPELRPPSIKGALRFWWRALNGHLPLHELKAKEDEIFGGTDGRSNVILMTKYSERNMNDDNVPTFNYIKAKRNEKGTKYFNVVFYHHSKEREGIAAGVKFNVILKSKSKKDLIEVANTFWVMSVLGSLGTRCRRGNGAFNINKVLKKSKNILYADLPFYYKNKDGAFAKGSIVSLKKLISLNKVSDSTLFSSLKNAQIFYSNSSRGRLFDKWYEALNDIAWKMMTIRDTESRKSVDRSFEKFTQKDLDKKAAFGLPFGILNDGMVNLYTQEGEDEKEARRASPIYITINKVGGKYYWTVTFLQGQFMPDDSKIIYYNKNEKEKNRWPKENLKLVNEFRKKLADDWGESNEDLDAELEALMLGIEYKQSPKNIKKINI